MEELELEPGMGQDTPLLSDPHCPFRDRVGSHAAGAEVLSAGFELPLFPLSVCSFPPRISNLNPERSSARAKGTGASVQHGSKYGLAALVTFSDLDGF